MTRGKLTTFFLWIHRLIHGPDCFVFFPARHMLGFRAKKIVQKIRETGIVSQESPTFSCGFFSRKILYLACACHCRSPARNSCVLLATWKVHNFIDMMLIWKDPTKKNDTPPKTNMDTQNDGPWKRWFLLNMTILGIYVRFLGGSLKWRVLLTHSYILDLLLEQRSKRS